MPTTATVQPEILPALRVGTFTYRGVTFLRADDLALWLDDARRSLPEDALAVRGALLEVRDVVREAGGVA